MWRLEQMAFIIDIPDNWSPFSILWSRLLSRFHKMSKILISPAVCLTAVSHILKKSAIYQSCFGKGKIKYESSLCWTILNKFPNLFILKSYLSDVMKELCAIHTSPSPHVSHGLFSFPFQKRAVQSFVEA
jgi:hypothetical protein